MSISANAQNVTAQDAQARITFGGARVNAGLKEAHAGRVAVNGNNVHAHDVGAEDVSVAGLHLHNAHVDDASFDGQLHLSGAHIDGFSWNPQETGEALKGANLGEALRNLSKGQKPQLGFQQASANGVAADNVSCEDAKVHGVKVRHLQADDQGCLDAQGIHADGGSKGGLDFSNVNVAQVHHSSSGTSAHGIDIGRVGKNLPWLGTVGIPVHRHDYTA